MELNAVIQQTILTAEGIQIGCTLAYKGKEASCAFLLAPTMESIVKMIAIAGKSAWEQLVGAPVKLRIEEEDDKGKVVAIGHFLVDQWLDIPQPEDNADTDKESE